ncbi:MAG: hypothetical protein PHH48_08400 [Eubacteriales bacterium]|nr:hypothetical protein [Eubacteriales bacterium]
MRLQDPVSILMHTKQETTIPYKNDSTDPFFYRDLRIHLQKNPDYREEKKTYRKEHHMSIEQSTYDFVKVYSKLFLNDVDIFIRTHPDLSVDELTDAFCNKWRGYYITYEKHFIKRAFLLKSQFQ